MVRANQLSRPIEILLVEDCLGDIELTCEILEESDFPHKLNVVRNGVQALDYLFQRQEYQDSPRPDLVILDLNLPRKDGFEVLAEVKSDLELRLIPVIILSSSSSSADVKRAYHAYANSYLYKASNLEEFVAVVRSIQRFWLTECELPY